MSKFVLFQTPNTPLLTAILLRVLSALLSNETASRAFYIGFLGALTVWAYLELFYGVNWFRKTMGLVFLCYIILTLNKLY